MSIIISVSIGEHHKNWLKDTKGDKLCSASNLLKKAIDEKMLETGYNPETTKELKRKMEVFNNMQKELREFIEERGLIDEFLEKKLK
jgi:hypothetical protein